MAHQQHTRLNEASIRLTDLAPRLIKLGAVLAVLGLGVACFAGLGDKALWPMFFHCYLVAFVYFLSITLGGIFFMMLHHLARAGWSVTVRRLAEGIAGNVYLMLLLAIPLLFGMEYLYHWAVPGVTEHDPILRGKAGYLSVKWFTVRMAGCFAIWIFPGSRSSAAARSGRIPPGTWPCLIPWNSCPPPA